MSIDIRLVGVDMHDALSGPIRCAFGMRFDAERSARNKLLTELVQRIAAFDGDTLIGSAGGYRFDMTTPGGSVPVSGTTLVAVLPSHRRRGILTRMMRLHIDQAHENGLPTAALWATEGSIYGRFGYGIASVSAQVSIDTRYSAFKRPPPPGAEAALLEEDEALAPCTAVYDEVRRTTPGMMSRTPEWWRFRRLGDYDKSSSLLQRVVIKYNGEPEGYALYRYSTRPITPGPLEMDCSVIEALASTPRANAALWRFLLDLDLIRKVESPFLHAAHPLYHLLADARRFRCSSLDDALWVRVVDVEPAFEKRTLPAHLSLTFQLDDAFCPWNQGVYRIADGRLRRASGSPELHLDASALGSLYLGGVTARDLFDAGDLHEISPGAVDRATVLFRGTNAPFCADIF
ncbi:MAG: GNAT family N-acetyltransferase [Polyangiaceae bacterium]